MKHKKSLLKLGAIQTMLMAIYHFFIPIQFQWREYLDEGIPTINWALFTINNYFSFILLVLGFSLMYHLTNKHHNSEVLKTLSWILLLFWGFNTVYQIVEPMPLPARLGWLSWTLVGISALNSGLFVLALLVSRKEHSV
ncbi:hypothetical protein BFP97_15750 [Roseivirga sp. 4D4]|uniref:hypothetical protein n=1 Tax=Roseivirga sp. 4D4 TaxID=1889784 RepID=UPI0008533077|nr:hypothetical protein [Roseivirga sp. 4D4]OEK02888.1 hypothetical protein BFP97_15750 [Roseivirga sp. 4D4]